MIIQGQNQCKLHVEVLPGAADVGGVLARKVMRSILNHGDKTYVLGSPTGSTPKPFYAAFIQMAKHLTPDERDLLYKNLRIVVMDDFVHLASDENIDQNDPNSAVRFIHDHFLTALAQTLEKPAFTAKTVMFPQVGRVGELRDHIIKLGGIPIQIVATDPFDGHVGQNFPGEAYVKPEDAKTAPLSEGFTKHHVWSRAYRGVTFDLQDFCAMVDAANGTFDLVITGDAKRDVFDRLIAAKHYDPALPISFLWDKCDQTTVYTDLPVEK